MPTWNIFSIEGIYRLSDRKRMTWSFSSMTTLLLGRTTSLPLTEQLLEQAWGAAPEARAGAARGTGETVHQRAGQ